MNLVPKKIRRVFSILCMSTIILSSFSVIAQETDSSASVFSKVPQTASTHKVALDPGHQGSWVDTSAPEPDAPGSQTTKARCTTGTVGSYTGLYEYELNLMISQKVRDLLVERGYDVFMTREDHDADISNAERAQAAAASGAEVYVRIHANGDDSHTQSGALTLYPSPTNPYVAHLSGDSLLLADSILTKYCEATGFANLGNTPSDDMTGINWSSIPVMILEMGFMTHPVDDEKMADESFQNTMAQGIADGIDAYFAAKYPEEVSKNTSADSSAETKKAEEQKDPSAASVQKESPLDPLKQLLCENIPAIISDNGSWAFYVEDLSIENSFTLKTTKSTQMQAASLIKLFIMGAIYEQYDAYTEAYGKEDIDTNLHYMITVSDNDAANHLVTVLGNGDSSAGMAVVNAFCHAHGFTDTHMGRLLLAPNDLDDNYTSVLDCGHFLGSIMKNDGRLCHTEDMLSLLCAQERRHKIPSGLPDGTCICGNKTGELSDVENDAAVIFQAPKTDYIFVVMSENLYSCGSAQSGIGQISSMIYHYFND